MKYRIKLAVLGALLAAGVAQAATVTTVTNFEQTLSVALKATIQGPTTANGTTVTTASVATKDVIKALGNALATNFSSKAQLLVITPTNTDNSSYWVVRDVVNKANVDTTVSDSFTGGRLGSKVKSSKVSNGKTTGTTYQIRDLGFQPPSMSPSLSFDLTIFITEAIPTGTISASGVGTGTVGANEAVFKGTFSASAYKAVKVKL
ncbi:MAG: hypothetical protein ABSF95_00050 [Verrucomicrobiota bacterium]|jgi:hypothetical protein